MRKKATTKKISKKPKKKEIKKKPKTILKPAAARIKEMKKTKTKEKKSTRKVSTKITKLKERPSRAIKKVIDKIKKKPVKAVKKVIAKIEKKPVKAVKKVIAKIEKKPVKAVKKVIAKIEKKPVKAVKKVIAKIEKKPVKAVKKVIAKIEKKIPPEKIKKVDIKKKEVYPGITEKYPSFPMETLPTGYGENSIVLMTVDPNKIFTFWEVRDDTLAIHPGNLNIRIYDVTGVDFDGRNANSYFDIVVDDMISSIYIDVSQGKEYIADIGTINLLGIFYTITRSNRVSTPRAAISEEGALPLKLFETDLPVGY